MLLIFMGLPPTQVKHVCQFVQVLFYLLETNISNKCMLVVQSPGDDTSCILQVIARYGAGVWHRVHLSRERCDLAGRQALYHLRNLLPVIAPLLCDLRSGGRAVGWARSRHATDVAGLSSCRNSDAVVSRRHNLSQRGGVCSTVKCP